MVMYLEKLNLPKKILFISLPAFIGLLPMPGGALFSAPMVDEATKKENFSPEEKTFINYWFRHIWEYFLPLYPGVILVSGLYGIPFLNFLKYHGIFPCIMILIGGFIIFKGKKFHNNSTPLDRKKNILGLIFSIFPVIMIFVFVFLWKIDTYIGVILSILFSFLLYRCDEKDIYYFIKSSFKIDMLIMILGIFYFKKALEITGAINLLPHIFPHSSNIAVILILTMLPFISGLLTGITIAYVGISFPILSSYFIYNGNVNMIFETLAYVSGFIGVLLSPVHLCLLLTNEYFKSNLLEVYKKLIPCGIILFISLIVYCYLLKFFQVQ